MIDKVVTRKKLQNYFKEIRSRYIRGDYTEGTYRTPLENLIRELNPSYYLIQEPKRTLNLGAPDFKAFYENRKVGFIETKDLDENLDKTLETEQIKRYVESIDNLLLTNYLRFILIRKGRKVFDINIFTLSDLERPFNDPR